MMKFHTSRSFVFRGNVLHALTMHYAITYPANSPALHRLLLHLGEVVVVCHHIGDDGLLIWVLRAHIWGVVYIDGHKARWPFASLHFLGFCKGDGQNSVGKNVYQQEVMEYNITIQIFVILFGMPT